MLQIVSNRREETRREKGRKEEKKKKKRGGGGGESKVEVGGKILTKTHTTHPLFKGLSNCANHSAF